MNLVKNKNIYFLISAIIIVPGLIAVLLGGLKQSIEFSGGSRAEYQILNISEGAFGNKIKSLATSEKIKVEKIQQVSGTHYVVQTEPLSQAKRSTLLADLKKTYPSIKELNFETVGPTIGKETEENAVKAVLIASLAIMAYIAFAFRKVSNPVKSWKFGICAIAALLHDVLIVIGIFAILGLLFHVEIDSLFITALLTVMGFSVHDTIVVFDRIRENLRKNFSQPFDQVVNVSLLETLNRSLNTSLTVIIVLFTLLMFGGESIRWFVVALLVGITAGTYSSIFNASQLLVVLYEFDKKNKNKAKK